MTGRLKNGRIVFDKCKGNTSICVVDFPTKDEQDNCKKIRDKSPDTISFLPYSDIKRCHECVEYTPDYKTALIVFKTWLLVHKDDIIKGEYDDNTKTCLAWAELDIGDFKKIK